MTDKVTCQKRERTLVFMVVKKKHAEETDLVHRIFPVGEGEGRREDEGKI
jgi:hypothetical protein